LPTGDGVGYIHIQGALEPKNNSEKEEYYWASAETLQDALHNSIIVKFPSLKKLCVLDSSPPFTKVRLVFPTPAEALQVVASIRCCGISPSQLFSDSKFSRHALQATLITKSPLSSKSNTWMRSNPPRFRCLKEEEETRFVYVCGLGSLERSIAKKPMILAQSIRQSFSKWDTSMEGLEIFLQKKQEQKSFHIGFRSAADAQSFVSNVQGQSVTVIVEGQSFTIERLYCNFAMVTQKSRHINRNQNGEPSRPECTSLTNSVEIPGLFLIENYITETQEASLMATLTGPQAPWASFQKNKSQTGTVKRMVQHYGYVFDYETSDVLRDRSIPKANCPPMPCAFSQDIEEDAQRGRGWHVLAGVFQKTKNYDFYGHTFPNLNQLTVNNYKPGQGIGSHVDTPSAFGHGLISISLGSGIVMEFTFGEKRKLVYLPRRSLVLMTGPARYDWEHYIVTRKSDTVQGQVLKRSLRVSLTFRTALNLAGIAMPLVESSLYPPTWGDNDDEGTSASPSKRSLATPPTERDHVHAVYDAIATQWHHTRGKRGVLWPGATLFLQKLPKASVVADIGCGDGKYFPAVWEAGSYVIGTDISLPLLETTLNVPDKQDTVPETRKVRPQKLSLQSRPAVAVADCMSVPLRDNSIDAAVCIAVLHHLSTQERRIQCIQELVRIVIPGGYINIQAWAYEQETNSRRKFAAPDVFVPFNAQPKYLDTPILSMKEAKSVASLYSEQYTHADYDDTKGLVVFQRYCHMYRRGELEELCSKIEGIQVIESGYESGNHFIILKVLEA
jgi:alkylated DNA repair protein alkB family protein 8